MRKLRVALGDEADTPRYIETLPRKGYRFISQLEDSEALPAGYVPSPFGAAKFEGQTHAVAAIGRRASDRRAIRSSTISVRSRASAASART